MTITGTPFEALFYDRGCRLCGAEKGDFISPEIQERLVEEEVMAMQKKELMFSEAALIMAHHGYEKHLCLHKNIALLPENLENYKKLVRGAKYVCKDCGRAAGNAENLCFPVEL
jgi:hypothetical protein